MTDHLDRNVAHSLSQHADREAIIWRGGRLTYVELADLAAKIFLDIASFLGWQQRGARVAVEATRSPATIATFIACVQNGWAYVPIPVDTPERRTQAILSSSGAHVHVRPEPLGLDCTLEATGSTDTNPRDDGLVWLPHTSGSTGVPKGVYLTTANLSCFVDWCTSEIPIRPGDRVAALSPFHFDLCTHDIYATLTQGGAIVLPDEMSESSPLKTLSFLDEFSVNRLYVVPTFLERLAKAAAKRAWNSPTVDTVMFAGERLAGSARPLIEEAFPHATLWNLYGPIETNVVTYNKLRRGAPHDSSALGERVPYARLAVKDRKGNVHVHGRGELLIGGPSVSPGYIELSDKTRSRFTTHNGERFFSSGDEATINSEGQVTLHGRTDNMVKIRGLRIELEEVESVIGFNVHVRTVGVVPAKDRLSLVAYVQTDDGAMGVRDARATCQYHLPKYMVPSRWVTLDEMPTTPSGKVDRQMLQRYEDGENDE